MVGLARESKWLLCGNLERKAVWWLRERQKAKSPTKRPGQVLVSWRRVAESNRPKRICNPLHNLFANPPRYL